MNGVNSNTLLGDTLAAVVKYAHAVKAIHRFRLWPYAILPSIIGLVLFVGIIYLIVWLRNQFSVWFETWLETFPSGWFGSVLSGFFIATIVLLVSTYLYKYAIIILSAPFMSLMSERIEARLYPRHREKGYSLLRFFRDIWRSFRINIRNLFIELLWILIVWGTIVIFPVLAPISVILWLVQVYFAGFGNMDYTMERYFKYRETIDFVRRNRGMALGNGMVFLVLLYIPLIGPLIAVPLAATASTLHCLPRMRRSEN